MFEPVLKICKSALSLQAIVAYLIGLFHREIISQILAFARGGQMNLGYLSKQKGSKYISPHASRDYLMPAKVAYMLRGYV